MDYWEEVDAAEVWFVQFLDYQFSRVRVGSGDAWIDLQRLRERLEREGLEAVARGGLSTAGDWEVESPEESTKDDEACAKS